MRLDSGMLKDELDSLRVGWDLIIDPDCPDFEVSKITTKIIIDALKDHSIKSFGLKYTGGKSFHIGIAFESFPDKVNGKGIANMYLEVGRGILDYLKNYIKSDLRDALLVLDNPLGLAWRVKKSITDISDGEGLDPFSIIEIDSMVISSRHMFRLPYSVNVKSLLVSMPIEPKDLKDFKKEDARPWKVKTDLKFLKKPKLAEASLLVVEAMDYAEKNKRESREKVTQRPRRSIIKEIPKEYFPPAIKKILEGGMQDGRKRSLLILINFLRNMNWDWEKITKEIDEWNNRNHPLANNYIRTQLRWHQRRKENVLPPNYDNPVFYKSIGIKVEPEEMRMKNPVNYVLVKVKAPKTTKKRKKTNE
jgi:hypothetical protein